MKFNLGDYDLGDLGLGDFSLGDLGLGDFTLDFDLIPQIRVFYKCLSSTIHKKKLFKNETESLRQPSNLVQFRFINCLYCSTCANGI